MTLDRLVEGKMGHATLIGLVVRCQAPSNFKTKDGRQSSKFCFILTDKTYKIDILFTCWSDRGNRSVEVVHQSLEIGKWVSVTSDNFKIKPYNGMVFPTSISSWDKEESTWEEASYTGNQFPPYAPPVGDWVWCISSQLYWSPGTREYLHPLNSEGLGFRFCTITKRWRHPNGYWEKNAPHEVWMNVRLTRKVESERAGRMMEPNVDILAVLGILPEAPKNMTGGHLAINHLNNSFSFPVWETEDHHYYDYLSGFWCGPGKEGWKILSSASRQMRFGANIVLLPHGNEDALQEE